MQENIPQIRNDIIFINDLLKAINKFIINNPRFMKNNTNECVDTIKTIATMVYQSCNISDHQIKKHLEQVCTQTDKKKKVKLNLLFDENQNVLDPNAWDAPTSIVDIKSLYQQLHELLPLIKTDKSGRSVLRDIVFSILGRFSPLPITSLPNDVQVNIFSFLKSKDITKVGRVCQKWNQLSKSNLLWKRLIHQSEEKNQTESYYQVFMNNPMSRLTFFVVGQPLKRFHPKIKNDICEEKILQAFPMTKTIMLFGSIADVKDYLELFADIKSQDKDSRPVIFEVEISEKTIGEQKDHVKKNIRFRSLTSNTFMMYVDKNGQIAKTTYLEVEREAITEIISVRFFDFKCELNMTFDNFSDYLVPNQTRKNVSGP